MDRPHVMQPNECIALLSRSTVGRVAFTARALPDIRSLAYVLVDGQVVLDTASSRLAERLDGQVVAFAVDELRTASERGWSVVVTGLAQRLHDRPDGAQLFAAPVPADSRGDDGLVRIVPGLITGRWGAALPAGPVPAGTAGSPDASA